MSLADFLGYGPGAFFYLLALTAQMSGYTSPPIAILLAIIGTLWLLGHWMHKWHQRRTTAGKAGVDPSYVIAWCLIGATILLAVASGTYTWIHFYTPKQLREVTTYPSLSDVEVKVTSSSHQFTPYEIELKLKLIDQVVDIISNEMEKVFSEGPRLQSGWWNALKDPVNNQNYETDLFKYRDFFKNINAQLDATLKKPPQYEDVVAVSKYAAYDSTLAAIEGFLIAYQYIKSSVRDNTPAEALRYFMKPYEDPFIKANQTFHDWRYTTLIRLKEIRKLVSS